jgi:hypothetical protein
MKRLVTALLICGFASPPACAGDLRDSISAAATAAGTAAASADTTPASREHPSYRWVGLVLIGAGTAMTLAGFLQPNGVVVSVQPQFPLPSINAQTTHSHALGVAGLGVMGAGTALLIVGERKAQPAIISVGPNLIAITKMLRF